MLLCFGKLFICSNGTLSLFSTEFDIFIQFVQLNDYLRNASKIVQWSPFHFFLSLCNGQKRTRLKTPFRFFRFVRLFLDFGCPQRAPFNLFGYLATYWMLKKHKEDPFTLFVIVRFFIMIYFVSKKMFSHWSRRMYSKYITLH